MCVATLFVCQCVSVLLHPVIKLIRLSFGMLNCLLSHPFIDLSFSHSLPSSPFIHPFTQWFVTLLFVCLHLLTDFPSGCLSVCLFPQSAYKSLCLSVLLLMKLISAPASLSVHLTVSLQFFSTSQQLVTTWQPMDCQLGPQPTGSKVSFPMSQH